MVCQLLLRHCEAGRPVERKRSVVCRLGANPHGIGLRGKGPQPGCDQRLAVSLVLRRRRDGNEIDDGFTAEPEQLIEANDISGGVTGNKRQVGSSGEIVRHPRLLDGVGDPGIDPRIGVIAVLPQSGDGDLDARVAIPRACRSDVVGEFGSGRIGRLKVTSRSISRKPADSKAAAPGASSAGIRQVTRLMPFGEGGGRDLGQVLEFELRSRNAKPAHRKIRFERAFR